MQNRRKQDRQATPEFLKVKEQGTGVFLGELANLSPEGAMFVTPGPVKPSTRFKCRVELPRTILGRDELLFEAECRWSRKNIEAGRWESGYSLTLTGIDAELISYLTLSLKLDDWGDRSLEPVATEEAANRRRAARYEFDKNLPVFEQRSYRQIGHIADISITGVRIIGDRSFRKGEQAGCRVLLPKVIFRQDYLYFTARCMWCRPDGGGDGYESGLEIETISERDAAIILHLLIHYARAQQTRQRYQVHA